MDLGSRVLGCARCTQRQPVRGSTGVSARYSAVASRARDAGGALRPAQHPCRQRGHLAGHFTDLCKTRNPQQRASEAKSKVT